MSLQNIIDEVCNHGLQPAPMGDIVDMNRLPPPERGAAPLLRSNTKQSVYHFSNGGSIGIGNRAGVHSFDPSQTIGKPAGVHSFDPSQTIGKRAGAHSLSPSQSLITGRLRHQQQEQQRQQKQQKTQQQQQPQQSGANDSVSSMKVLTGNPNYDYFSPNTPSSSSSTQHVQKYTESSIKLREPILNPFVGGRGTIGGAVIGQPNLGVGSSGITIGSLCNNRPVTNSILFPHPIPSSTSSTSTSTNFPIPPPPPVLKITYTAPLSLQESLPSDTFITPSVITEERCIICFDDFATAPDRVTSSFDPATSSLSPTPDRVTSLQACGHQFHYKCIMESLNSQLQCPICRKGLREPQGKSPSGIMKISTSTSKNCEGYYSIGSILISYRMNSGIQRPYHDSPGVDHGGKSATAYLPNNREGQELLKRLKFAFKHGLTFTVGTSLTTNKANQCTWASIHHKTSPSGGVTRHGFPDSNYFANVNEELDGLRVPSSMVLDENGDTL